jgi:hypothetical protein
MTKFYSKTSAAALTVGIALIAQYAEAAPTPVPLDNPTFINKVPIGWTLSGTATTALGVINYSDALSQSYGIERAADIICVLSNGCDASLFSKLSQTVNTLITGHKYQLNWYAYAWAYREDGTDVNAGPMKVQLGDQVSDPIPVNSIQGLEVNLASPPLWAPYSFIFTYTGSTSSADLSFIQNYSGLTVGCVPCGGEGENLFIANASLSDLGDGPGPGPNVSEPGTLGILALGLGGLGLFYNRRRNGAV